MCPPPKNYPYRTSISWPISATSLQEPPPTPTSPSSISIGPFWHPRRRYEHRILPSGLKVLLVEDPDAQKSSYAMAVEVWALGTLGSCGMLWLCWGWDGGSL